jgi:hypothetical protein
MLRDTVGGFLSAAQAAQFSSRAEATRLIRRVGLRNLAALVPNAWPHA